MDYTLIHTHICVCAAIHKYKYIINISLNNKVPYDNEKLLFPFKMQHLKFSLEFHEIHMLCSPFYCKMRNRKFYFKFALKILIATLYFLNDLNQCYFQSFSLARSINFNIFFILNSN